ncbi:MAG: 16S rRNA (cytosine(1402)-N(4))-methyltransferase RsmH [Saprospiraceae bacterium]
MEYHDPVLLPESIEALKIKEDGVYVDVTFGGGGHSKLILDQLGAKGRLFAFDQDEEAVANVFSDERLHFIPHNFRYLKKFLRLAGVTQVDGILGDLGVSSHQLDKAERGFSYRFEALLDMRMNQQQERKASDILSDYTAADLQEMFSKYGEVRNAKTLAKHIVANRHQKKLLTIGDFLQLLEPLIRGNRNRYLAQVFQALRIELNEELLVLEEFLVDANEVLKPNGRLVLISYHSLEDRLVKNFLKTGNVDGSFTQDFYGNIERPFKLITKKPILASDEETARNPRARSAKMRIAEKPKNKKD